MLNLGGLGGFRNGNLCVSGKRGSLPAPREEKFCSTAREYWGLGKRLSRGAAEGTTKVGEDLHDRGHGGLRETQGERETARLTRNNGVRAPQPNSTAKHGRATR